MFPYVDFFIYLTCSCIASNAWTAALLQIQSRSKFPLSPVINIVSVDCLPLVRIQMVL